MEESISITDTKGRTIIIKWYDYELDIHAEYNGRNVGTFEFDYLEDNASDTLYTLTLLEMDINSEFRNAGIGQEMMKFAIEIHRIFELPSEHLYGKFHDGNYLTDEGARLINKCFEKGILMLAVRTQPTASETDNWL